MLSQVPVTKKVVRKTIKEGKLLNQYLKIKSIGEGPYSKIKLMTDINTKKQYAMKKYNLFCLNKKKKMSINEQGERIYSTVVDEVREEVEVWKTLNHHRIARLHEILEDQEQEKLYLFMDYCEHGDFASWDHHKQVFTHPWKTNELLQLFIEATQGVAYQNVVHRDLKPQNILINSENHVKLIDFGRSVKLKTENAKLSGSVGTYQFMAPEMLSDKIKGGYDGKCCDIWSLGVSFFSITFGYLPFSHQLELRLFELIEKGEYKLPEGLKEWEQKLAKLLKKMLSINPGERPTAMETIEELKQIL